ncbi:MAG: Calx-beta domain-containing protein [Amaricoccus sp.]
MGIFQIEAGSASEGNSVDFTITRDGDTSNSASVDYYTIGGSALEGVDFYRYYQTVTFEAGETSKTISIGGTWDNVPEPDEAFLLALANPIGDSFGGGNQSLSAIGWIRDNDTGGGARGLAVSAPTVTEDSGTAAFTISLSKAFDTDTTFSYGTVSGSARSGSDFTRQAGTVTFIAGQTEATVLVDVGSDHKAEANETFGLKVFGNDLAAFAQAHILDDDARNPVVSIEGGRAVEGEYVDFILRLSKPSDSAVTVDYHTLGGSAHQGDDFYGYDQTVTFAAGETTKVISVGGTFDNLSEPDESFQVEISNPVGAGFGAGNQSLSTSGWILDDDAGGGARALAVSAPTLVEGTRTAAFTISLSEAFDSSASFSYSTVSGSARAGSDFVRKAGTVTFAAGQTEATVLVNLLSDSKAEAGEFFGFKVAGEDLAAFGQAHILDNDSSTPVLSIERGAAVEGTPVNFIVRLSEASNDPVTVDYSTLGGSASEGADFYKSDASLTFAAGETTKIIGVSGTWDSLSEPDESFQMELSNAVGANFGKGLSSLRATGWILDDDPGADKLGLRVENVRVKENAGTANFLITLSQPLDHAITLQYGTQSGTARAGHDFVGKSGSITLAAGQTEAVVGIRLIDSKAAEASESFNLRLSGIPDDFLGDNVRRIASATIEDDSRPASHGAGQFDTLASLDSDWQGDAIASYFAHSHDTLL